MPGVGAERIGLRRSPAWIRGIRAANTNPKTAWAVSVALTSCVPLALASLTWLRAALTADRAARKSGRSRSATVSRSSKRSSRFRNSSSPTTLQELDLDLEQVALADVARPLPFLVEPDGPLVVPQGVFRETHVRPREQDADELLTDGERQHALGIGDLGLREDGLVARRVNPPVALSAPLEQVANARVELHDVVERIGGPLAGLEHREELRIPRQERVRTQGGRHLLGATLFGLRSGRPDGRVVRQRQSNRLLQRDSGLRLLRGRCR